jgi:hypothetical protein
MIRKMWDRYGCTVLLGVLLTACNTNQEEQKNTTADPLRVESIEQHNPVIVVKEKSRYSEKFVSGLKELDAYEKLELHNNLLIIDEVDTAYFPEVPAVGTQVLLKGEKDNLAVTLTVKRINYTTIDYELEMLRGGSPVHRQSGQADMAPTFFFGAESDEYDPSGMAYLVTEFAEHKSKDCYTYIRLGVEEEGSLLLGKIKKNCNDEAEEITLENFPNLIQQK